MKNLLLILFVGVVAFGCSSDKKFDSNKWKNCIGFDCLTTDLRESMLNDLIESEILLGKDKVEVLELLGKAEMEDGDEYSYTVREKYGFDIDPNYIRVLTIRYNSSGKVIDVIDSSIN